MARAEEMHAWTVKMSTPSVLAVVTVFSMIPGGVLSDTRGAQGLEAQQLAQGSSILHRRLKRGWIWKQLFVPEEDPTPRVIGQVKPHIECAPWTTVAQVTATDADDPMFGNNAKLIYSILQGEPYFSVEPKTGLIVTSWPNMDREAREEYLVVVQVKDMLGLSGGYSSSTTVTVSLTDVNDNGPTFHQHLYNFAISENAVVGTTVGRIKAEDGDTGINARMTYTLEDDLEESATFIIQTDPETQEGVILLAKPLDFESKRRYVVAAEAANDHVDTRFLAPDEFRDRTRLKIVVEDVDEPPVFLRPVYEWKVPENVAVGTAVGGVGARDTDVVNNAIRYSIDKRSDATKAFQIDPNNGTIAVVKALDRETTEWHNVTVEATETSKENFFDSLSTSGSFIPPYKETLSILGV
ncbi:unnamed protein product [Menidia menidia]|uniref:(Atlantic silverside) hypothetical protein n=1 Tax=Menidia menidia TaxID=238744 RepID=A0A8S4AUD4_9TELE|nr:unnamed protein product [Menidia menidia]